MLRFAFEAMQRAPETNCFVCEHKRVCVCDLIQPNLSFLRDYFSMYTAFPSTLVGPWLALEIQSNEVKTRLFFVVHEMLTV